MANSFYTLANLLVINDKNVVDAGASDILDGSPFLAELPAIAASHGTVHKYVKETTAPTVGFRAISTTRFNSASTDTQVTATLNILDGTFIVDKAEADSYTRGGAKAFLEREGNRALRQLMQNYEKQIFGGTTLADSGGFAGFADTYDTVAHGAISAAGTTASTGSSVYLIRATPDERHVMAVVGNKGQIQVDESVVSVFSDTGGIMPVYVTPVCAYVGLQVGTAYSAARIANLTADSGKGLTDTLLYQAISTKFKATEPPTHIVMNRRSLQQLRASRTATNNTGAPAPYPTELEGIKIIVTESIGSTETLIS